MKKTLIIIWIAVLAVALGSIGCGEKAPEAPVVAEKSAEEIAAEAEAKRREQETDSMAERVGKLTDSVRALSGTGLPTELEAGVQAVGSKAGEIESLMAELKSASGDSWQSAKSRLEAALGELSSAQASAAAAADEWKAKVAAAEASRSEGGSVVNWDTGLIEGLDGGQYPQYLPSALAKIQEHLRGLGHYAGPADGTFCKPTLEAVGAYQESVGLHVSGVPSPMTRERMFADAG